MDKAQLDTVNTCVNKPQIFTLISQYIRIICFDDKCIWREPRYDKVCYADKTHVFGNHW